MTDRTLVASASNLLARGFLVVPTDRKSRAGDPVNGLFAVARAIQRVLTFKAPARAVAVIDPTPNPAWPPILQAQLPALRGLVEALGEYQQAAADAAWSGDARDAVRALAAHPLVRSIDLAERLYAEMADAHRAHLPARLLP